MRTLVYMTSAGRLFHLVTSCLQIIGQSRTPQRAVVFARGYSAQELAVLRGLLEPIPHWLTILDLPNYGGSGPGSMLNYYGDLDTEWLSGVDLCAKWDDGDLYPRNYLELVATFHLDARADYSYELAPVTYNTSTRHLYTTGWLHGPTTAVTAETLAKFLRDFRCGSFLDLPYFEDRILAEWVGTGRYKALPRPRTAFTYIRHTQDSSQGAHITSMVTSTGTWNGHEAAEPHHLYDVRLSDDILKYLRSLKGVRTVYDLGCGHGKYSEALVDAGYFCVGVDGNPATQSLTKGFGVTADLSLPIKLPKTDAVICLDVGEHLPSEFERQLLSNLDAVTGRHLILSWAVPGQGGLGHFNELPNAVVKEKLAAFGFTPDETASAQLRASSTFGWFKNTIMVFHRKH
jgi:hypothetical protein